MVLKDVRAGQPSKQTVSPPREFAENEEKAETPVLENAATFEPQQPTQYDELIAEKVAPSEASLGERQQEIFDSPTFKQQTPAGNAQEEMEAQPNIAMPVKSSSRAHIPLRKRGSSFSGGPFDPQPKLQRRRSVDDLQSYVQLSRQPLRNEAIDKEAPSQPASNGSKSPNAGQKDGSSWGWWVAGGLGLLGLFGAGYYVHSKYRRS